MSFASRTQLGGILQQSLSSARPHGAMRMPRRAGQLVVRASKNGKNGWDIDRAWASFKEGAGLSEPDSYVSSDPTYDKTPKPRGTVQKDIRQQESQLLDVWATTGFMKAGAGVALVFFFVFVFVIGPPPSDGRCTLPWC